MPTIVPIDAVPAAMHEELLDAVFGDDRTTRTAYRIREGLSPLPGLSFAALDDDGYLAGTIELWPVSLTDEDGRQYPLLMVGPVAVAPSRQNEGYGRALMAAALGMAFALPGIDSSIGQARLTFGSSAMLSGFGLLPVLIGAFAISQILRDAATPQESGRMDMPKSKLPIYRSDLGYAPKLLRGSVIGTWIGLLPGIGANIAALVSYSTEKHPSKEPEKFGTGHEPGVVAAESANNASIGGALIPLITMGIPGSVTEAILIGALTIHNLQPGPLLFQNAPEIAYGIIAAYLVANVLMLMLMWGAVRYIARIVQLPRSGLMAVILVFCVTGSYAVNSSFSDVWVMIGFGLVGLGLEYCRVPLGPFVIGFVLSPIAEEQLRASLMMSDGNLAEILTRPYALLFLALALITVIWPYIAARLGARARAKQAEEPS